MSDETLRRLERRWQRTGDPADEARYLKERVRAGVMTTYQLELTAHLLGSEGAARVLGAPVSAETFRALLREVPWFVELGQPNKCDGMVLRVPEKEWTSPQSARGDALVDRAVYLRQLIESRRGAPGRAIQAIEELASGLAAPPGYEFQDPDEPVSNRVGWAGYWSGTVAGFILLGEQLPFELSWIFSWLAAGHWPCGYESTGSRAGHDLRTDLSAEQRAEILGKLIVV